MDQIINWINKDLDRLESSNLYIYDHEMYNEFKNGYNGLLSRLVNYENSLLINGSNSFDDELMKIKIEYAELSASFDFFLQYQGGINKIANAQKQKIREELVKISGNINADNYEKINAEFTDTVNVYKNSKVDFTNDPTIAKIIDYFNYSYIKCKIKATKSLKNITVPTEKIIRFVIEDVNRILSMDNIDEEIKSDLKKYTINSNNITEYINDILLLICFGENNLSYNEIRTIIDTMDEIKVSKERIDYLIFEYVHVRYETVGCLYAILSSLDSFENLIAVTIGCALKNPTGLESCYFEELKKSSRFNEKKYIAALYKYTLMYVGNEDRLPSIMNGFKNNYPEIKNLLEEQEVTILEQRNFDVWPGLARAIYQNHKNDKRAIKSFVERFFVDIILNIADDTPDLLKDWFFSSSDKNAIPKVFKLLIEKTREILVVQIANECPNKKLQKEFMKTIINSMRIKIDSPIHNEAEESKFDLSTYNLSDPLTIFYISQKLRNPYNIEILAKNYNQCVLDWWKMSSNYFIDKNNFGLLKYLYKYERKVYYSQIERMNITGKISLDILTINPEAIEELFGNLSCDDFAKLNDECLDIICEKFKPYVKDDIVEMYNSTKKDYNLNRMCMAYIMYKGLMNFEFFMMLQAEGSEYYIDFKKKSVLNVKDGNKKMSLLSELKKCNIEINKNDYDALIKERSIDTNNPTEVLKYKKFLKDCIGIMEDLSEDLRIRLAKIIAKSTFEDIIKYFVSKYPTYNNIILENLTNEELYNYVLALELNLDETVPNSGTPTHK